MSDALFRPAVVAANVTAVEAPASSQAVKINELRMSTPDLVAKGKQAYLANCMVCHGAEGRGDGPAATALNPKPRDFTSGVWKQGGSPAQVFKTVSDGMSGTPMPPFSSLSLEERWGLVHFVRGLSPNPPADTKETLALIGVQEGAAPAPKPVTTLPELPVKFIMERMTK